MRCAVFLIASLRCFGADRSFSIPTELPGTAPLRMSAEWREQQRQEILQYLDGRISRTQSARDVIWKPATVSRQEFVRVARQQRSELRKMLGIEDHPGATLAMTAVRSALTLGPSERGVSGKEERGTPAGAGSLDGSTR